MKRNKITQHLSLRAKFKDSSCVEVVIMNDIGEIQIELIPIKLSKQAGDCIEAAKAESASSTSDQSEDIGVEKGDNQ